MENSIKNAIQAIHLCKIFPGMKRSALSEITTTIRQGEITGIVGPDGAGKTTLIRLMTGLLLPTSGDIRVLGFDTTKDPEEIHERIGYMPQKFGLYEDLTVIENLNLYAKLRGLEGSEKKDAFQEMFHFTALHPFVHRLAKNLSGGMKQKLGLACALLGEPKVLLLDEPSTGIDPLSRRELWKMVNALTKKGITVIWSTSYLDEADKCQNVLLLNEGKLLFSGPPQTLTQEMKGRVFHLDVPLEERRLTLRSLLNKKGVIDGLIQGNQVRLVTSPSFKGEGPGWHPIKPRFEDAFVDILGGVSEGDSVLAKHIPPKKVTKIPPIQAKDLTKRFGAFTAARNISFTIKQGEIFGLLGPNGAGKSTIFKMLCGLLQPTEGTALVSGLDLKRAPSEARSRIGYMAQKFSLYGDLSVRENLDFFSGAYGLQGKARKEKINQMVGIFHLSPYLESNAGLLPLGYKQRLALACAVMHEPDVLFLDEPTAGVDPLTRREFWAHINGMVEKGVTLMVTTHFMEEAEYCDRIALIYQGLNIATGTPDHLKQTVKTKELSNPTLEDAFITLIQRSDALKEKREEDYA